MGWDAKSIIALAGVIVAPSAALAGAWLNSYLGRKQKAAEQAEASRRDVALAAGPMFGIVVDANPDLVLRGQLREYDTPEQAVEGLYNRWTTAREPLLVLSFGHPSERIRDLAFRLQLQVEMSLRQSEGRLSDGDAKSHRNLGVDDYYSKAVKTATELAAEITRTS